MTLIEYINQNLSIDEEYYEVFAKQLPNGKMFCPFHDNHNTPAAKKYGNGIKCFGQCNRYFSVYDFIKRFNPNKINEVKQSVLLPRTLEESSKIKRIPVISSIDRNLPIQQIVQQICNLNLNPVRS